MDSLSSLKTNKAVILALVLLLLAASLLILFGHFQRQQEVLAQDRAALQATGVIEATTVNASFKVPGRLDEILVREGDRVEKKQELARLETRELEAKLMQAKGALEAAQGQADQAQAAIPLTSQQIDAKVAQAEATVAKAEVGVTNAQQQLDRVKSLFDSGAVSQSQLDQAQNAYDAAVHDHETAQGLLDEASSARIQVQVAESQYTAASGMHKQAAGALAEAQAYMDNAVLISPISGYITGQILEAGEMLNAGTPVLEISDLEHTYVSVFIDETKIGRVKLDQKAEVKVDAYPDRVFSGKVVWINDAGQFAVKKAVSDQYSHDIRSFEVKIDVPNEELLLKTGMTAVVNIVEEGN